MDLEVRRVGLQADLRANPVAIATLVGTRPGGGVAAAWAVISFLCRDGYTAIAERLLAMNDAYVAGIREIDGMTVFGAPDLSIIGFGAPGRDIGAMAAGMGERGWIPGMLRELPGLHMTMSLLHEPVRPRYLADLAEAVFAAPAARNEKLAVVY